MAVSEKTRRILLDDLRRRNETQCHPFVEIFDSQNKLLEAADLIQRKNVELTLELEKTKQECLETQLKMEAANASGNSKTSENIQAMQTKVYKLMEELTEMHRKKGENAQQIIDLNNLLKEKDQTLTDKETKLQASISKLECLVKANQNLEQALLTKEATNQMLADEQQALQLAFCSLEEKNRKLKEENNELVKRWMEHKGKQADGLNAENDAMFLKKQEQMKKDIDDALKEHKNITMPSGYDDGGFGRPVCMVTIPSKALCEVDAHDSEVNAVRWSPSGRYFATGGADRKLKLWEIHNGKCEVKGTLAGSNAAIMATEFDYEETLVLGTSNDFATRIWSLSDLRLRHTLTGHSGKVLAAKFLLDRNKLASGSHDRTLKIWDLVSRACIRTIFAGSACNDLVTTDAGIGGNVISGHFDRKIRFWDTRVESSAKEISFQGRITSLDLAPDRTSLLCCARDDTIKTIDLRMNQMVSTLSADGFHVGSDWSRAVYSPDGEYIMAGSNNGDLYVWNVAKRSVAKILKEHANAVVACSWKPTGESLLSCDKHRKVIYWSDFS